MIGHSLIIVALFAIIADDHAEASRLRDSWLLPLGYAASLALFLTTYYAAHAALFGTTIF